MHAVWRSTFALLLLLGSHCSQANSSQAIDQNSTTGADLAMTSHLSFSHVFSAQGFNDSFLAVLRTHHEAIHKSQSELIVITSLQSSHNNSNASTATDGDSELKSLLPEYSIAGESRVLFKAKAWQPVRDAALNGSVWTRLKAQAKDNATADVCVVMLPGAFMDSPTLIQLTARADTFCAPQDISMMGFTEPISDDLAQYLTAESAINGQYAPRKMTDMTRLALQTASTQLNAAAALNRLFIALPTATCVDGSSGMSDAMTKTTHISVKLCVGPGCSACVGSPGSEKLPAEDVAIIPVANSDTTSSGNRGLVVLLSCGSFLIGCAVAFYLFFRHQFFMPSESTKQEKELTTNLAYVLRM